MTQLSRRRATHPILRRKSSTHIIDVLAYTVGVAGNAAVIPQIIRAWQGKAPGLAILTWILFIGVGLIWLAYAVVHKQKPLVIAQAVCLIADAAVVAGWLYHSLR